MGGARHTISTQNLLDLAKRFNVTSLASAMALDGWQMAGISAPTVRGLQRRA